jgi:hypothetical protein
VGEPVGNGWLYVQDAIIDYAGCGIINAMPYPRVLAAGLAQTGSNTICNAASRVRFAIKEYGWKKTLTSGLAQSGLTSNPTSSPTGDERVRTVFTDPLPIPPAGPQSVTKKGCSLVSIGW